MAITLLRTTYNRTLESLSEITYSGGSNGRLTAYVPFSATSFSSEMSSAEVDDFGRQWCRIDGMQQYGLDEHIYLLKLSIDVYRIYDSFQSRDRTATVSGIIATKNEHMSFPFEFKITQIGCASGEQIEGDVIFWRLNGSSDVLNRIESADAWRGNSYCTRVIGANTIVESKLIVSHCVDLSGFYRGQTLLTNVILEGCDFSIVTTFSNMFHSCKQLTEMNLSDWNFDSAENIQEMFSSCTSLTSVTFPDESLGNCRNISSLFADCTSLTNAGISGIKTDNVTTMANMFLNCSSLESVNVSNFSTSNCTSMINVFNGCSSLTQLDLRNWDVSECTSFSGIFGRCNSLTNIIGGVDTICGTKAMIGAKSSIDISQTNLDLPSIVAIFLGLEEVSETSNVSIKIKRPQRELAMDYFGIAQSKNWKIVVV